MTRASPAMPKYFGYSRPANIAEIAAKVTERAFHKSVAEYLTHALPSDCYSTTIPGGAGGPTIVSGYRSGCPDYLIIFKGRPILIELKTKDGRLSKVQQQSHVDITLAGGLVTVVRSIDELEEFLSVLQIPLKGRV